MLTCSAPAAAARGAVAARVISKRSLRQRHPLVLGRQPSLDVRIDILVCPHVPHGCHPALRLSHVKAADGIQQRPNLRPAQCAEPCRW